MMHPSILYRRDSSPPPNPELVLAGDCSSHDWHEERTGANAVPQLDTAFNIHNELMHGGQARMISVKPHVNPERPTSVSVESEV